MEFFSRQKWFILCGGIVELNYFEDIKTSFIANIPRKYSSIRMIIGYGFL